MHIPSPARLLHRLACTILLLVALAMGVAGQSAAPPAVPDETAADRSQICHRRLVSKQSRPLAAKEGLCARHPNTIHGRPRTLNRPTRRLEPSGGNGPTAKFAIRVVVCGAIDEPCAVDKARSRRSLEILRACWITFIQIVRRRHIAAKAAVYGGGPQCNGGQRRDLEKRGKLHEPEDQSRATGGRGNRC